MNKRQLDYLNGRAHTEAETEAARSWYSRRRAGSENFREIMEGGTDVSRQPNHGVVDRTSQ